MTKQTELAVPCKYCKMATRDSNVCSRCRDIEEHIAKCNAKCNADDDMDDSWG